MQGKLFDISLSQERTKLVISKVISKVADHLFGSKEEKVEVIEILYSTLLFKNLWKIGSRVVELSCTFDSLHPWTFDFHC